MKRLAAAVIGVISTAVLSLNAHAVEDAGTKAVLAKLNTDDPAGSLTRYIAWRLARPRYFEAKCSEPVKDNPIYPGIPYKECTYTQSGLTGWVQLAVIPPEMISRWIVNACSASGSKRTCVARVTSYMWASNQFSYPIVGNIVESANSAGGTGDKSLNLIFLHGVTVPRPVGIPEDTPIAADKQKELLTPLAGKIDIYGGKAAQVSRPAGVRREIYLKYGDQFKDDKKMNIDVGFSCPDSVAARKTAWLDVSRQSFVAAWGKPHHRLIDALAKALEKDEFPGRLNCKNVK